MKASIYLTFTRTGPVKMTKAKPHLSSRERAVRLSIQIPDAVFDEPPLLDAQLDVPADKLAYPTPIAPIDVEIWG